jgi:integrase
MRGSIIKRSKTSWSLVIDQGRDPNTKKRKQKWISWPVPRGKSQREAMKLAEAKLAELLHQVDKGTYVDASKVTLIEYLRDWHSKAVLPLKRSETARVYLSMIDKHIAKHSIATLPLQKIRPSHLEQLYAETTKLGPSSLTVLHAVVHKALKTAMRDQLIVSNPAAAVEHRPRPSKDHGKDAREHCWTADEARKALATAKADGPQVSALFAVLLDTGCRKSEALGLTWSRVDLENATVTIDRQLAPDHGKHPTLFLPTKTGKARTVTLGPETVARLRTHRKRQRELRLANGPAYENHDLVFAKEAVDCQKPTAKLGQPCRALVGRHFGRVVKSAEVRRIKTHGLRHTSATLLLTAGVPVQVVAQRLGHAHISMTLEVYAHALPDMQRDAAARLAALLGS